MFVRISPEQHDTLDGVPEPSENSSLFGHADAKQMLAQALGAGKLPHALIFAGPQGIGKATLAFHLANFLLGRPAATAGDTIPKPDAQSSVFRQIASGAHPSVLHLTRPPNDRSKGFKTVLTVDEVRKVGRFVSLTAHDGGWRMVIVDSADDLNRNAANALLKNLEEPPAKTLFVLITHAPGRLLPTIRSRAQMIKFGPLSEADLQSALQAVGDSDLGGPQLTALSAKAGGSVRNAILLSQYGGLEIAAAVDEVAASATYNAEQAHRLADAVSGRDRAIPFAMFNDRALDVLSQAASKAAVAGDRAGSDRLAAAWQEARLAVSETLEFNLDQKLHALTMIARLNAALHPGGQSSGRM